MDVTSILRILRLSSFANLLMSFAPWSWHNIYSLTVTSFIWNVALPGIGLRDVMSEVLLIFGLGKSESSSQKNLFSYGYMIMTIRRDDDQYSMERKIKNKLFKRIEIAYPTIAFVELISLKNFSCFPYTKSTSQNIFYSFMISLLPLFLYSKKEYLLQKYSLS